MDVDVINEALLRLELLASPVEIRAGQERGRLDADRGRGMAITVGRVRPCTLLDLKFALLGHNTIRGAAGAAILNAELMHREGLL